ncbi:MAG: NAD-dependent epimerase/dehydratase family protein [Gemmatimonadetes bacterium]|nr:NAD-dependent epimerase/dehydratase family protein [Gemmatimonadota bacterium]NIO31932.1 NAD-dependent epimerase/dehydratase family protein [Gemmatimonadota bacterium]
MNTSRRHFLKSSIAAGGALGLGLGNHLAAESVREGESLYPAGSRGSRSLEILILGGTNFTGPHHVRYALERGHSVTIFTRGRRRPGLFQDAFEHVEQLIGDREDDLEALRGRNWDAVIDASGMNEKWTRDSAELLKDAVGTYLYISSTGVYYPYLTTEIEEDTELVLDDASEGENMASWYGVMKARSEIEARKAFGERTCIVRPGYIVGPLDWTHRGTYWPDRLARGGEVLVPGKKSDLVQQIDVRDLTEWIIHLLENEVHGVFNATGPASPMTMQEFVHGMRAATSSEVTWTWIEDYEFLIEHEITYAIPWVLPVDDNLGSQRISNARAKAAGLTFRPVALTAMETLDWYYSDGVTDEQRANPPMVITPEREAEILTAWKAR